MKKKYYDEPELQRAIVKHLNSSNKQKFNFEITPHDFDVIDPILKIFIEVKLQGHAPAQLIYAIVKKNKQDCVNFLGLANTSEIRFYKAPTIKEMEKFAKKIDPTLNRTPSSINTKEYNTKAFKLLGEPWIIYTYEGNLDLSKLIEKVFITDKNYDYFERLLKGYRIDPLRYLPYIADNYSKQQRIIINNDGRILNINTGIFYYHMDLKQSDVEKHIKPYGYKTIKHIPDKRLFEMLCVKNGDLENIIHYIDHKTPIDERRSKGRFFTSKSVSKKISSIIEEINPDYIIEPYVGAGSLIEPLKKKYSGVANDIIPHYINILKKRYEGLPWKFTNIDGWTKYTEDYIKLWDISKDKNNLILFNPPFGTSSTHVLTSKKDEIKNGKKSRKIKIDYAEIGDIYGRGDMVLPAIGRMIEIIKELSSGYLAFFCPAGVMYGRIRYSKILKTLLRDFEFIKGYIFTGDYFEDVSSKNPVAFTVWKYHKNTNTDISSLRFIIDEKVLKLKKMTLLKEGWKYNTCKAVKGEIGVQRCDAFNTPHPKNFNSNVPRGGSEVIPENVKIDLNVQNVPSELVYGLWSVCVSKSSITNYPTYMNDAYIHLPNFSKQETLEILAYTVIYTLIKELKLNYCKKMIGFVGMSRIFNFGKNKQLTKGAKYLIDTYGYCKIGDKNIIEVFNELKELNIENINKYYRRLIKKEIEKRLETIGYWDYIPIPKVLGRQKRR